MLLALPGCGEDEGVSLHIEGVGEVEGPLLVYVERGFESGKPGQLFHIAVHDLGTGKGWVAMELDSDHSWLVRNGTAGDVPWILVAGDGLLVVGGTELEGELDITRVSLDGRVETVLAEYPPPIWSPPKPSPDGKTVVFADHVFAIVVLDIQSGDEVLRVERDDPRVEAPGVRWPSGGTIQWSPDGAGFLLSTPLSHDVPVPSPAILMLDGGLHVLPEGAAVSDDLRYVIRGQALVRDELRLPVQDPWYLHPWTNLQMRGFSGSFEVVELSSGRVLRTVIAEGGHSLWYVGSSPRHIYYVVSPQGSDEIVLEIHALDITTGETDLVSGQQMFERRDSGLSPKPRLAFKYSRGECFEVTAAARAVCEPLLEAVEEVLNHPYKDHPYEVPAGYVVVGRDFLGLIWLD